MGLISRVSSRTYRSSIELSIMDAEMFLLMNGFNEQAECSKPKKPKLDNADKSTKTKRTVTPQTSVEKDMKKSSGKKSKKLLSKKSDFPKTPNLAKKVLTKNIDLKLSKPTKRQHTSQKIRNTDKKEMKKLKIPKKRPKKPASKPRFNTQKF